MTDKSLLDAWAPQSEVVELPSGRPARLRKSISLFQLVRQRNISAEQFAALEQLQRGELQDIVVGVDMLAAICYAAFLEPRITPDGKPINGQPTVSIDELSDDDQVFVLERAFGGTSTTEGLRDEPDGARDGEDGALLGDTPKRADRPAKRQPGGSKRGQRAR
jgi:hypothetical protein